MSRRTSHRASVDHSSTNSSTRPPVVRCHNCVSVVIEEEPRPVDSLPFTSLNRRSNNGASQSNIHQEKIEERKRRKSHNVNGWHSLPLLVCHSICFLLFCLTFVLGILTIIRALGSFLNPESGSASSTRRASSSTILFEHRNLGQSTEAITAKMSSSSLNASPYRVVEKGHLNTLDYRIFVEGPNGLISPWHDIPLYADKANKVFNMVVEIPRWSNAKMEMATKEVASPIKQDEKGGKPRFVHNIFPFHGYIWNYGALPQTWEDPNHKDEHTGALGDNDPIDVVEIGSKVHHRGAVVQVKVIGVLALLDDGETDWKLVTIENNDPLASQVNTLADVEEHFPGLLNATREWFRIYKIPAGKKANAFGFDGEYKDKDFAHKVIEQTHQFWLDLVKETSPPLNTESHYEGAAHPADQAKWSKVVDSLPALGSAADEPEDLQKWHFVKGSALASSPK